MNFKSLLSLSTSAQVVAFLAIICNYSADGIPVPVPGPGGVSQVGFSIYRNKEEYDAARGNDKVIVTYAVSHPTNTRSGSQGNLNPGADVSRNYYDYTQHFGNHQQHQKQIESFRQEQQQQQQQQQQQRRTGVSSASNYYGGQPKVGETRIIAPATAQASVRVPSSLPTTPYKPTNQAPTFLVAPNNKPTAPRRQQQNRQQAETMIRGNTNKINNAPSAGSQMYFANNYLQKPSTNIISNPSDLLRQQQLVALAKIAKSKNGKLSEALDLNEALDASYPVKYY